MTALARLLLVLTSLAPVALVYAAVLADKGDWTAAAVIYLAAFLLALLCLGLLAGARRVVAPVPMEAGDISPKEGESLSFLVAYALPLLAVDSVVPTAPWGLVAFTAIVALVLWQQQIFHINPVLTLLGFHFYSARNDSGGQVLILTHTKALAPGVLNVTKLSPYLWLEHPDHKGARGNARLSTHDTSRRDGKDGSG